jgi:hypothetical protein
MTTTAAQTTTATAASINFAWSPGRNAALTFLDLCGIQDSDPRLKSAYPFLPWAGQDDTHEMATVGSVADAVFRRWKSPYWPGGCAANRAWEPGELEALSDLHHWLTGQTCSSREKQEEIEAERQEAADDRLIEAAAHVMREYCGTRLYGALRRAGLEDILRTANAGLFDEAWRLAKS